MTNQNKETIWGIDRSLFVALSVIVLLVLVGFLIGYIFKNNDVVGSLQAGVGGGGFGKIKPGPGIDCDRDNDGYYGMWGSCPSLTDLPLDCNDTDNQMNPGRDEKCDGKDNDCSRVVDEGTDADGDGYYSNGHICYYPSGSKDDCNDNNQTINPSATEVCDSVDNNCDGLVNEGWVGIPSGLVSWWKAENNAVDSAGYDNNGTLNNGVTFSAGKVGNAFSFDGINDVVMVPDNNNLDFTNAITIEMWVKPQPTAKFYPTLIVKSPINTAYGIHIDNKIDGLNWDDKYFTRIVVSGIGRVVYSTTTFSSTINQWTHIATTYDGSSLKMYVNGALQGTLAVSGPIDTTATGQFLGNYEELNNGFNGTIDELSLYNRALTAAEISAIYNATSGKC